MHSIEEQFKDKAIIRGNLYFFRALDAISVIQRCRMLNRVILGIDAFILTAKTTQPLMEQSINYTDFDYQDHMSAQNLDGGHWAEAIKFIEERMNEDYYFEVVYRD
jgi:hypothetical protein